MSSLIGTYGHGTENDFVLVFDPSDSNNLSTESAQQFVIAKLELALTG